MASVTDSTSSTSRPIDYKFASDISAVRIAHCPRKIMFVRAMQRQLKPMMVCLLDLLSEFESNLFFLFSLMMVKI